MLQQRIGFVGGGQMARALARGFVESGLVAAQRIVAADVDSAAVDQFLNEVAGAQTPGNNTAVVDNADVIFLAVKPQHIDDVTSEVAKSSRGRLFVSIAAGVPLARLARGLQTDRVIRVMPNTPCLVGQGASAYCRGNGATAEDAQLVDQLLRSTGIAIQLDEYLLDAVTGLSGSGPAFVYQFIEALGDGGVRAGLPRDVAHQLATQTVLGAAAMVQQTSEHPATLKDRVTSPGGTTIAGLHALEAGKLRGTVMSAVVAATERSRELGQL